MARYVNTRNEINSQLNGVSGIGKLFKSKRNPTNWKAFLELYKDSNGKISVCWFYRVSQPIAGAGRVGSEDERGLLQYSEEEELWRIELFYGFDDDDTTPSEFAFQALVEGILDKFRFLQDLNGKAFKSYPLQLVYADLFSFLGGVLSHKAEFILRLVFREENPNADA